MARKIELMWDVSKSLDLAIGETQMVQSGIGAVIEDPDIAGQAQSALTACLESLVHIRYELNHQKYGFLNQEV